MPELAAWNNFYLIVGSAAGALIGLQFVVMTLIAQRPPLHVDEGGPAFATPAIYHFSSALFLSAILCVPWQSISVFIYVLGLTGFFGIVYITIVAKRIHKQHAYNPVSEDWLYHVILPSAAYLLLLASSFAASSYLRQALYGVGASALLLLLIGIHNAWDNVVYHIFVNIADRSTGQENKSSGEE